MSVRFDVPTSLLYMNFKETSYYHLKSRRRVVLVLVGVIQKRQLSVGLGDLSLGCGLLHAKNRVEVIDVASRHYCFAVLSFCV